MRIPPEFKKAILIALLVMGIISLPAAQSFKSFHTNTNHFPPARQCINCHGGHNNPDAKMIRMGVLDRVCRTCHSPSDIAKWKAQDIFNNPNSTQDPYSPSFGKGFSLPMPVAPSPEDGFPAPKFSLSPP